MHFKNSVTLLVMVTLFATAMAGDSIFPAERNNEILLNLMAASNGVITRNPSRSADCFNEYIQLIDEIAKSYQRNHDACIQASRDGRAQAEAATVDKRNELAASAVSSCNVLSQCSDIEEADKVFECYVAGGSANSRTMYVISNDASEHLSDLREQFRLVENREYKCTNDTKRQYERDSVQAYDKFNRCNLGITEKPEDPESTEAPAETEPTEDPETPEVTETPVETEPTEEPEVPENTENPENPEVTEDPESPENPESDENLTEAKLPEEDLSLRQRLKSRFSKRRFNI